MLIVEPVKIIISLSYVLIITGAAWITGRLMVGRIWRFPNAWVQVAAQD